jgi:acyl transferase domain-containing protein
MARRFRDFAAPAEDRGVSFADMYYSAAFRRSHHEHRLGVAAGSSGELATLLEAYVNDEPRAAVASGHASAGTRPKLAFVCTGMGPQWWAMGRRLFADEPVFRESILCCDEIFRKEADWSLLTEMMADEPQSRMAETQVAQTANFAIQMALAALWKSWGIEPDAIVGHSVGEVGAAYLSGALSLEDAIRVSFHRSRLQQTTAGAGAMMAVGLAADEVRELLGEYGGRISVAAVNGPTATTVSGDPGAIEALGAKLTAMQVFNRQLRVDVAYHSAQMDPLEAELLDTLRTLNPLTAKIPLYSTVTGDRVDGREFDGGYWWRNVREPVEFRMAMESLVRDGFDCFLEIGPHPVLASSIVDCVAATGEKAANYCSLRRGEDERTTMLSALGSLYSIGMPVRWEAFQRKSARFVRLPQYPWQRERYWSESEESLADRLGATPHPLLGFRLAGAVPVWETEIGAYTLPYLSDHAVKGATVFPGAAYVEMALAAGREVFGAGDFAVERIQFERALFLPDGERPKVQTSVDAANAAFEIHSKTGAGGWARNAAGRLTQRPAQARTVIDQSEIAQRCAPPLDAEACYSRFAEQGFHYGPAFQKISRIVIGEGEALAWLDDLSMAGDEYQIHPTVLDACFQVLVATDPLRATSGVEARTYLPVGVDKIEVTMRPEGSMWAWARLERQDESGAKGSIWLCDADGNVAVSIEGFEVKALDRVEGTLTQDQMQRSMYEMRWSAQPAAPAEDSAGQDGRWLVFADETGTAAAFAQALEAMGAETIAVKAGTEYGYGGGRYTVNPSEPEDFKRLFEDAALQSRTLAGVAHFWNLDLGQSTPNDERELNMAERKGALSVLHLAQALATSADTVPLWLVTRGAQAVKDGDSAAVMQAPVWGLGRVIGHQEHGSNWGGLIDLAPVQADGEAEQLIAEMRSGSDEDQIAFRDGERYVLRLERCANLKATLPARFRADATYLITGAFGALGALTARWMTERGARRLVLMGRSSLPERSRWNDPDLTADAARRIALIRELESKGAAVMIAAADAGDSAQVDAFVREFADAGWPAVRGVIHSAGLVHDQLMLQMDAASFLKVLRPKVHGAWNLHRALEAMPLDFFVLYSSIGSVVAATGQANYASANAFLDALAHHRKHLGLASTSINWGPWAAGMVADLNLAEYFAARGLETITPEHGMRFLGHAMAQRGAQMAVLSADWGRLFEFQPKVPVMLAHLASEENDGASSKAENETDFLQQLLLAEEGEQSAVLEQHVQALAARVLRMDRERIDVAEPLSAFGLDSMMATELKNRLEMSLRIPVSVLDFLKGLSISEFAAGLLPRLLEENGEIRELLAELEAA